MLPIAIDYTRFSSPAQAAGDSRRRQKSLADAWSDRTGIPIDLRLADEGVSGRLAARRTDDRYELARLLKCVESGRIQPGDYLLLENLDRLRPAQINVHAIKPIAGDADRFAGRAVGGETRPAFIDYVTKGSVADLHGDSP